MKSTQARDIIDDGKGNRWFHEGFPKKPVQSRELEREKEGIRNTKRICGTKFNGGQNIKASQKKPIDI
jgi:hypothetical protein